jgi:site-specific recombinase XerD
MPPRRPTNAELRGREYLTAGEVRRLMKAAARGRFGHRDATLILVAYRHGLRASEVADLECCASCAGNSRARPLSSPPSTSSRPMPSIDP